MDWAPLLGLIMLYFVALRLTGFPTIADGVFDWIKRKLR